MSLLDFGYWIRGLVACGLGPDELASQVLRRAPEFSGAPKVSAPPAMTFVAVGNFCVHNIHLKEACRACLTAGPGLRQFALRLPDSIRGVYIKADEYSSSPTPNADGILERRNQAAERGAEAGFKDEVGRT